METNRDRLIGGLRNAKAADDKEAMLYFVNELDALQPEAAVAPLIPGDPEIRATKGFSENLKNPIRAMKEDSLPANAMKVMLGTTDKEKADKWEDFAGDPTLNSLSEQMRELEQAGMQDSEEYKRLDMEFGKSADILNAPEPEFSMDGLLDAAKEDPGAMAAHLVNGIAADPYLLATPIGWEAASTRAGAALVRAGAATRSVGKAAAGATGAAAAGGAIMAPISAFEQLNTNGTVDESRLAIETGMGAVGSVAFAGIFKAAGGMLGRIARKRGVSRDSVDAEFMSDAALDLSEAVARAARELGGEVPDEVLRLLPAPARLNLLEGPSIKTLRLPGPPKGEGFIVGAEGVARSRTAAEQVIGDAAGQLKRLEGSRTPKALPAPEMSGVMEGGSMGIRQLTANEYRAVAARADGIMEKRRNSPFADPRLKRDIYRENLKVIARDDLTKGGGIARVSEKQIDALNNRYMGESGFRTPSQNPKWVQDILKENSMSVKEVGVAIDKALDNQKLGVRQKRVVVEMLDRITESKHDGSRNMSELLQDRAIANFGRSSTPSFKQSGEMDPRTMAALAVGGAGAAIGYAVGEGDPATAAAYAAIGVGALVGKRMLSKAVRKAVTDLKTPDSRIRIKGRGDDWEAHIATQQRQSWQIQRLAEMEIKNSGLKVGPAMERITYWLDGDKGVKLQPAEMKVAKDLRTYMDAVWASAKREGVIEEYLDDYITHLWRHGGKTKAEVIDTVKSRVGGMSTKTRFSKERTIPTLKEGIEKGLVPETLNAADIVKLYADSVNRAIANKRLVASIKEMVTPEGGRMIEPTATAPANYVPINHPQLMGSMVHPDIAPSMKFMFNTSDPNLIARGVLALNFASKRSLVSMSFFHANALAESLIFAGGRPSKVVSALKMLREGKAGDTVDVALRAGLKIGTIEDVGPDIFYSTLRDLQTVFDDALPGLGVLPKAIAAINKKVDVIMWDKIATGSKLATFIKEYEKAILRNGKLHEKNPSKYPLRSEKEIAENVAEYVNDAFGGLNWRRIAENTRTELGRDLKLAAHSPSGRMAQQILLFAPDWTIANFRVLTKALPGMSRSKDIAALHRWYTLRSALFFATAGNALNYIASGHLLWDNKDPLAIDLGDGRKMTASKQFAEPFHWIMNPGKTAVNKMGLIPRTILEIALNSKWMSANGAPQLVPDDATSAERAAIIAGHVGQKFLPIAGLQIHQQGAEGITGFFGHPIYGKKEEEKSERPKRSNRPRGGR